MSPHALKDIVADPESGLLYVTDVGDGAGNGGVVFRITPKGKVDLLARQQALSELRGTPSGIAMDGASNVLVTDATAGTLLRVRVTDGAVEKLADNLGTPTGLAWDHFGRLFIADAKGGRVHAIARPGGKPVAVAEGFQSIGDLCLEPATQSILVVDSKAGTVKPISVKVPGMEVDTTPLPLHPEIAFPNLKWTGWKGERRRQAEPHRPLLLTHAGDGSDRVFVATQQGVIHVFPNDQAATKTKIFLDIQRPRHVQRQRERGGLPRPGVPPEVQGERRVLRLLHAARRPKLTNVVSRFRVSKDDPNKADPASEEELLRVEQPFWNHDGGTIVLRPRRLSLHRRSATAAPPTTRSTTARTSSTLLGKILRIDVDHKDAGQALRHPQGQSVRRHERTSGPEIWAYGLRNVWRMAFDRKTGQLWAARRRPEPVRGDRHHHARAATTAGTSARACTRSAPRASARARSSSTRSGSTTTTSASRSPAARLPRQRAARAGRLLPLRRLRHRQHLGAASTTRAKQPRRRQPPDPATSGMPIMSFGEDEQGEVYYLTSTTTGQGIYWFVRVGGCAP